MKKIVDYVKIICSVIIKYLLLIGVFLFTDFILRQYDLKFQAGFIRIGIIVAGMIIAVSTLKKVKRYRECHNSKNEDVLILIILIMIPFYLMWLLPLEKDIGGVLCEWDKGYVYYDKKYFCMKSEFQWDAEHEIKVLENQFDRKFAEDNRTGKEKRRYTVVDKASTNVEIIKYPDFNEEAIEIIEYKKGNLQAPYGRLHIRSINDSLVHVYLSTAQGEVAADQVILPYEEADLNGLSREERYMLGIQKEPGERIELIVFDEWGKSNTEEGESFLFDL